MYIFFQYTRRLRGDEQYLSIYVWQVDRDACLEFRDNATQGYCDNYYQNCNRHGSE
jgi:hypothetical protein